MKALTISVLVLVTLFASAHAHSFYNAYSVIDAQRALYFLRSQYVEEAGLLRAAVRAYSDNTTIYVANDNVLAARALAVLGDGDLSSKILTKLNNEYGGGFNGRIEILFGVDIPDVFYTVKYDYIGEVNGFRILYEKPGDRVIEDWYKYADLVVYRALDRLLWGSRPHAELLFLNLTKMWSGYGFRDKAYEATGVYDTYKCALFIYLYRALEVAGSDVVKDYVYIRNKCLEVIALAQDPETDGIRTNYRVVDGRIIIEGDVNVETTSIIVLALYSDYPLLFSNIKQVNTAARAYPLAESVAYMVLAVAMLVFTYKFVKAHLRKTMLLSFLIARSRKPLFLLAFTPGLYISLALPLQVISQVIH
ncbi:MAG: hypothetical protein QW700_01390 [Desulfurococcaceae archaeon]